MIKKFLLLTIFFLLFTFFPTRTWGQISDSQEQISVYSIVNTVNKDGSMEVRESILYNFGNQVRHGIYRSIPYTTTNKEGKKYQMEITNVTVTDEKNIPYIFSQSKENDYLKLKIGDPNKTISGFHNYLISYKVAGALTYFSDHDELYWNMIGNKWEIPIVSFSAQVALPRETQPKDIKVTCFTGAYGSTSNDCDYHVDNFTVGFAKERINPFENFTVVVGFPKGIVAVLEPKPVVNFFDTILGKIVLVLIGLAVFFWYVIYPVWIPLKWYFTGRDPRPIGIGETRAWFDPPKTKNGRPLTPAETGTLVDEKAEQKDISALVVDLARRGYMKIVEKKKGKFSLVKTKDADDKLIAYEKDFLADVFGTKQEVSLDRGGLVKAVSEVKKTLYEIMVKEEFFPKNPEHIRVFYTVIAALALMSANLPLSLVAFIFGRAMPKKTIEGAGQAAVARSLRNFLNSQERQLEFQAKNQMFFEKLLPFAVAFGVERVWAGRFKDIDLHEPSWYQGTYGSRFNSAVFTSSLNSSLSNFRNAATPVTSSTRHSSGFSGGFSGGGGGGGGGGSW